MEKKYATIHQKLEDDGFLELYNKFLRKYYTVVQYIFKLPVNETLYNILFLLEKRNSSDTNMTELLINGINGTLVNITEKYVKQLDDLSFIIKELNKDLSDEDKFKEKIKKIQEQLKELDGSNESLNKLLEVINPEIKKKLEENGKIEDIKELIKELYDLEQKLGNNTKVNETYYKIEGVLKKVVRNLKILNEFINSTNAEVLKELDIAKEMSNITTLEDLMKFYKEKKDYLKNNLKVEGILCLISKLENLNKKLIDKVSKNEFLMELKNVFPNASEINFKKIFNQTINETVSNTKEIFDKMVPIINRNIIDSIDKIFIKYNNENIKLATKLSNLITDLKTNARKKILIAETKGGIIYLTQELENSLLSLGNKILKTLASELPISLDDEIIDNFFSDYKNKVDTFIKSIKTFVKESKELINSTLYESFDEKKMVQTLTDFLQESRNEIIETLKEEYLNKNIFEIYNNVSAKIKIKLEELEEKIIELNITQLTELYQNLESKLSTLKKKITENEKFVNLKNTLLILRMIYPFIQSATIKEIYLLN